MEVESYIKIFCALITILGVIITTYLVPFMKSNMSSAQLDELSFFITLGVRAAEQIYKSEEWREKKEYVLNYTKEILNSKLHISLTDEQINAIIEGIVNEVKHS